MKQIQLAPNARRASEILEAVAKARGCRTPEQIAAFLDPLPTLTNPLRQVLGQDYRASLDRIAKAVANRETVAVYGDIDADGICATVQVVRFLRAAGANVRWFVPNRIGLSTCGLTTAGIIRCRATHNPSLIVAVDCGSNSRTEILALTKQRIDTIVLDHHQLSLSSNGAIAHLNPLAHDPAHELTELCASGLAFLWSEALAEDLGLKRQWERIREGSLILAGVGTVADQVPVTGLNRALIKHATHWAQQPIFLERVPGLVALSAFSRAQISARAFSTEWAPRINACGRMDDPATAVQLLLAPTVEEARPYALACDAANRERQVQQERVRESALIQAEQVVQKNPSARVLVIRDHSWHPGVVSSVAPVVRDHFNRPVLMLGWSETAQGNDVVGTWAGSGRGYDSVDLTQLIAKAIERGIVISGGGHPMAVGVRVSDEKVEALQAFLNEACADIPLSQFQPTYEVLGNVDDLAPESWVKVFTRLAPFGRGNPMPFLGARRAQLAQPPYPRRARDAQAKVFAMSGMFRRENAGEDAGLLQFDWMQPVKAQHIWFPGRTYDLVLTVAPKNGVSAGGDAAYSWRVADCEPAA